MTDPETTETATPAMTAMDAHRLRMRMLTEIRDGWYGGRPRVSPHGRRTYSHGRVQHLTLHHEARQSPPPHDEGRAYLRRILTEWRTTYAPVSTWDDAKGGPTRRALVAAGQALADPSVDGQERADELVGLATRAAVKDLDKAVAGLLATAHGEWSIAKASGPRDD